jgi:hypothetical protein
VVLLNVLSYKLSEKHTLVDSYQHEYVRIGLKIWDIQNNITNLIRNYCVGWIPRHTLLNRIDLIKELKKECSDIVWESNLKHLNKLKKNDNPLYLLKGLIDN